MTSHTMPQDNLTWFEAAKWDLRAIPARCMVQKRRAILRSDLSGKAESHCGRGNTLQTFTMYSIFKVGIT